MGKMEYWYTKDFNIKIAIYYSQRKQTRVFCHFKSEKIFLRMYAQKTYKSVDEGKPYDKRLMSFKTKKFCKFVVKYKPKNEM